MRYRYPPEWRDEPGSYWDALAAIREELARLGRADAAPTLPPPRAGGHSPTGDVSAPA